MIPIASAAVLAAAKSKKAQVTPTPARPITDQQRAQPQQPKPKSK